MAKTEQAIGAEVARIVAELHKREKDDLREQIKSLVVRRRSLDRRIAAKDAEIAEMQRTVAEAKVVVKAFEDEQVDKAEDAAVIRFAKSMNLKAVELRGDQIAEAKRTRELTVCERWNNADAIAIANGVGYSWSARVKNFIMHPDWKWRMCPPEYAGMPLALQFTDAERQIIGAYLVLLDRVRLLESRCNALGHDRAEIERELRQVQLELNV